MTASDTLRVMIVDDEPMVRLGLTKLLGKMGDACKVVGEARNGMDALEKIERLNPNLVFSDIRMPNMDGIAFSQKLAQIRPDTFVVLLTGYADFEYARQGIRASVFDYLLKPAEVDDLRKVVIRAQEQMIESSILPPEEVKGIQTLLMNRKIESLAIQEAVKFILSHYHEPLGVKELSAQVYLNASYFSVLFKKETGYSFSDFLTAVRIEKAKELLKKLDLKIYAVAERSGFQTGRYFTEVFKDQTGMLPSEYRNMPN